MSIAFARLLNSSIEIGSLNRRCSYPGLDRSFETHTVLAVVRDQFDWDWHAAEDEFKRAIECNPNYAFAYQRYSRFLLRMGRFNESCWMLNRALEIEPLSLHLNVSLGSHLIISRRIDEGIVQMKKIIRLNPNYFAAYFGLAQAFQFKGAYDRAISTYHKAISLDNNFEISCRLGQIYGLIGKRDEAEKILSIMIESQESQYISPYYLGLVYFGLGDLEQAFFWFDKSVEERSSMLTWMLVHPELDSLRSDPRFSNIAKRIGLHGVSVSARNDTLTRR